MEILDHPSTDLLLGERHPLVGRTDDGVHVVKGPAIEGHLALVEEPVRLAAREGDQRVVTPVVPQDRSFEQQVDAENRAGPDRVEVPQAGIGRHHRLRRELREAIRRDGADDHARMFESSFGHHAVGSDPVEGDAADARTESDRPARRPNDLLGGFEERGQVDVGDPDRRMPGPGEEALLEDLHRMVARDVGATQVARAHDDRLPEEIPGTGGLRRLVEELREGAVDPCLPDRRTPSGSAGAWRGRSRACRRPRGTGAGGRKAPHGAAPAARPRSRGATRRIGPPGRVVPADPVEDPESGVEIEDVRAAPHDDVLAVVEPEAGARIVEAGGPPTELPARLEDDRDPAGVGEPDGRGEPGHAGTDDHGSLHPPFLPTGNVPPARASRRARKAMRAFRQDPRRTRFSTT